MEMTVVDAGIGDEQPLRPETETDALGYACDHGGKRRADGAVENPYRAEAISAQQRDQPDQIDGAPEFGASVFEIHRFGNARFRNKQLLGAARGGARNVTLPPGDTAAMARMNGRCQMTLPMPRFDLDNSSWGSR